MAVKTLDSHIKKAFIDLGFTEDEVKNGCWLLERENKKTGEMVKVAWIALHKFLERVAIKAGITFDKPEIFNLQPNEIAMFVQGHKKDLSAWAIGEASDANLTSSSKAYRWAMAEKRAKDRVILKLLGVAGDMYSEEEADEFKENDQEKIEFEKEAKAEKTQYTKSLNKAVKAQDESLVKPVESDEPLSVKYKKALKYLNACTSDEYKNLNKSSMDKLNRLEDLLKEAGCAQWLEDICSLRNKLAGIEVSNFY